VCKKREKCVLKRKELCQKKEIMLLEKSRRNVSEKEGEVCKEGEDYIETKREVC
jgi:hypothetical protein